MTLDIIEKDKLQEEDRESSGEESAKALEKIRATEADVAQASSVLLKESQERKDDDLRSVNVIGHLAEGDPRVSGVSKSAEEEIDALLLGLKSEVEKVVVAPGPETVGEIVPEPEITQSIGNEVHSGKRDQLEKLAEAVVEAKEEKERNSSTLSRTFGEVDGELKKGIDYAEQELEDTRTVGLTNGPKPIKDRVQTSTEAVSALEQTVPYAEKPVEAKKPEPVELPKDVFDALTANESVAGSTPEVNEEMLKGVEKEQEERDEKNVVDREARERFSKTGIGTPRGVLKHEVEPGVVDKKDFSIEGLNAEADKMVAKRDVRRSVEQEAREKMQAAQTAGEKGKLKAEKVHVDSNYGVMEMTRNPWYLKPIQDRVDRWRAEKANKSFNQISVETVKVEAEQKSNEQKTESLQAHIADLEAQHDRAKFDTKIGSPAQAEKLLSKIEAELRRSKADLSETKQSTKELALQHEILKNQKNLQEQYRTAVAEKIQRKNDERLAPQKEELKQVDAEIERFQTQIDGHKNFIKSMKAQVEKYKGISSESVQRALQMRIDEANERIDKIKQRAGKLIIKSSLLGSEISKIDIEAEAFAGFIIDKPIKRPDVKGAEVFSDGPNITSPDVVAEKDIETVVEEAVAEPVEDKKGNSESTKDAEKLDQEALKVLNKKIKETQDKMKKNGFVPTGLIGDKELKEYNNLNQKGITTLEEYNKLTELHKKVDQAVDAYIKRKEKVKVAKAAQPVQENKPTAPEAAKPPLAQEAINPKAKTVPPPENLPTVKGINAEVKPENVKPKIDKLALANKKLDGIIFNLNKKWKEIGFDSNKAKIKKEKISNFKKLSAKSLRSKEDNLELSGLYREIKKAIDKQEKEKQADKDKKLKGTLSRGKSTKERVENGKE